MVGKKSTVGRVLYDLCGDKAAPVIKGYKGNVKKDRGGGQKNKKPKTK